MDTGVWTGPAWALRSIEVRGFRGIRHLHCEDLPPDASWIFMTGENGFGKTTVLQAIALGLAGYREEHTYLIKVQEKPDIQVSYQRGRPQDLMSRVFSMIEEPIAKAAAPMMPSEPMPVPLACYGPSRLQLQAEESQNQAGRSSSATYGLFHPDALLRNIEYELKFSYLDNPARFMVLSGMFKRLIPALASIEVRGRTVWYTEQYGDAAFPPVTFGQLASGYRSILALAGDVYLRLAGPLDSAAAPAPSELEGFVLIDELDLHLHPKYQRLLPGLLSAVFPQVQFIASTHSPIPLLGAPERSVFLTVRRTGEEGITLERLEYEQFESFHPNLILSSPIFGLEDLSQVNLREPGGISGHGTYQSLTEQQAVLQDLIRAHAERVKRGGA